MEFHLEFSLKKVKEKNKKASFYYLTVFQIFCQKNKSKIFAIAYFTKYYKKRTPSYYQYYHKGKKISLKMQINQIIFQFSFIIPKENKRKNTINPYCHRIAEENIKKYYRYYPWEIAFIYPCRVIKKNISIDITKYY